MARFSISGLSILLALASLNSYADPRQQAAAAVATQVEVGAAPAVIAPARTAPALTVVPGGALPSAAGGAAGAALRRGSNPTRPANDNAATAPGVQVRDNTGGATQGAATTGVNGVRVEAVQGMNLAPAVRTQAPQPRRSALVEATAPAAPASNLALSADEATRLQAAYGPSVSTELLQISNDQTRNTVGAQLVFLAANPVGRSHPELLTPLKNNMIAFAAKSGESALGNDARDTAACIHRYGAVALTNLDKMVGSQSFGHTIATTSGANKPQFFAATREGLVAGLAEARGVSTAEASDAVNVLSDVPCNTTNRKFKQAAARASQQANQ